MMAIAAGVPLQESLFADLLPVPQEDAEKLKASRHAFTRRLAVAANTKKPGKNRQALSLFQDVLGEYVQLALPGLTDDAPSPLDTHEGEWTENEINVIHEAMLFHFLRLLKDSRLKQDHFDKIVEWIAEPLFTFIEDPEPFTFAACCLCAGLGPISTESMQDLLLNQDIPAIVIERQTKTRKGTRQA